MRFRLKLYHAKFEIQKEMGSDIYTPVVGVKKNKDSFSFIDLKML